MDSECLMMHYDAGTEQTERSWELNNTGQFYFLIKVAQWKILIKTIGMQIIKNIGINYILLLISYFRDGVEFTNHPTTCLFFCMFVFSCYKSDLHVLMKGTVASFVKKGTGLHHFKTNCL